MNSRKFRCAKNSAALFALNAIESHLPLIPLVGSGLDLSPLVASRPARSWGFVQGKALGRPTGVFPTVCT